MPDLVRVVFGRILLEYADVINQIVPLASLVCRAREITASEVSNLSTYMCLDNPLAVNGRDAYKHRPLLR